jgi:putative salt-induced outer membrane protein YdiY
VVITKPTRKDTKMSTEYTADAQPRYSVAYSTKQNAWYIKDNAEFGEPVSGLYDTQVDAELALAAGAW